MNSFVKIVNIQRLSPGHRPDDRQVYYVKHIAKNFWPTLPMINVRTSHAYRRELVSSYINEKFDPLYHVRVRIDSGITVTLDDDKRAYLAHSIL